jgi:hypothetical protein
MPLQRIPRHRVRVNNFEPRHRVRVNNFDYPPVCPRPGRLYTQTSRMPPLNKAAAYPRSGNLYPQTSRTKAEAWIPKRAYSTGPTFTFGFVLILIIVVGLMFGMRRKPTAVFTL